MTIPLPSFGAVEAALLKTTERLAHELRSPAGDAPDWNVFEWRVAEAVAAMQGISALLAQRSRWGPPHWQAFLAEQKTQTLLREQAIAGLLSRIDASAREARIAIVALKGAALLRLGIYPTGVRPMADVDLLVDAADAPACAHLLATLGYSESHETARHKVFVPENARSAVVGFGEHIDNPVRVELHTRIAVSLPIFETDITPLVHPRRGGPGLNSYLSTAALMRHLLLNAAGDLMSRGLRLIQLHDIALLAQRMLGADWEELIGSPASRHCPWWALPPLVLTARYYPGAISPLVIAEIAPCCPWLLRHVSRRHELADVSWSKVRTSAFPGIEWSRSPREAVLYAKRRIWPDSEVRSEMERTLAAYPRLTVLPWYRMSRPQRILRWMLSHPPRVQTMLSVRAALDHEPGLQ